MTISLSTKGGSNSFKGQPLFPAPIAAAGGVGRGETNVIPYNGTLIDNIKWPANPVSVPWEGFLDAVSVWTVGIADLDAAVDNWVGGGICWLDDVNGRLYIFGEDTGTSPGTLHVGYITLETGAVTDLGNAQFTTSDPDGSDLDDAGHAAINRAAVDSGDFTMWLADRKIVINSATGAFVSEVIGSDLGIEGFQLVSYVTLDATVGIEFVTPTYARIYKGGSAQLVNLPSNVGTGVEGAADQIFFMNFGNDIVLAIGSYATAGYKPNFFKRTEFDSWLSNLAIWAGL